MHGIALVGFSNGMRIQSAASATVSGCYFGIDPDEPNELAVNEAGTSSGIGLWVQGVDSLLVGGTTPGTGNFFRSAYKNLRVLESPGFVLVGNHFGVHPDGVTTPKYPITGDYLHVEVQNSPQSQIGGANPLEKNVFSRAENLSLKLDSSPNSVIQGNHFGVAGDGLTVLHGRAVKQGAMSAIEVTSGNVLIGGNTPWAGNVFANIGTAVWVGGTIDSPPTIQGNYFGISRDRSVYFPISLGLLLANDATLSVPSGIIGGFDEGEPNVFNCTSSSIMVASSTSRYDIRANEMLRADWWFWSSSRTENDPGDSDTGPNELQNHPEITAVNATSEVSTIEGILNSYPNEEFRIDLYASNGFSAGTFHSGPPVGQAAHYLGSTIVTTDGQGDATFELDVYLDLGEKVLMASATNERGATSQPSLAFFPTHSLPEVRPGSAILSTEHTKPNSVFYAFSWFNFINFSDQHLTYSHFEIFGDDAEFFHLIPPYNFVPFGVTQASLRFHPQRPGLHRATVRIHYHQVGIAPTEFEVVGLASESQPALRWEVLPGSTVVKFSELSLQLGAVVVGDSRNFQFLATPANEVPVPILTHPFMYLDDSPFQVEFDQEPPFLLEYGETALVNVTFTPTEYESVSRQYLVEVSDEMNTTQSFSLNAIGITDSPIFAFESMVTNFGNVPADGSFGELSFTIHNHGTQPLVFNSGQPQVQSIFPSVFHLVDPDRSSMAPGSSRTFTLRFTPTLGATTYYSNVTLFNNSSNQPFASFFFQGTGQAVGPVVSLPSPNVDFGIHQAGSGPTDPLSVTMENVGIADLILENPVISGPDSSAFQLAPGLDLSPIAPDGTREIALVFYPEGFGEKSATLQFTTNDPNHNPVLITLTGLSSAIGQSTPFTGVGPGFSRVGPAGDYNNLIEVAAALQGNPTLTVGDWTFYITGDFSQGATANLPPVDTNGHQIIFRPEPGSKPTITYTHHSNSLVQFSGQPGQYARNYLFDGSATEGENNRDLTLATQSSQSSDSNLFMITDYSRDLTFRNLNLINRSGVIGSTPSAFMTQILEIGTGGPVADIHPVNMLVENCLIESLASSTGAGFTNRRFFDGNVTTFEHGSQWIIRDNIINVAGRAFFADHIGELLFQRNTIRLQQVGIGFQVNGILLSSLGANPPSIGQHITIRDNRILKLEAPTNAGTVQLNAILIDQIGEDNRYDILNNMIGGVYLTREAGGSIDRLSGISISRATSPTINILHNSVNVVPSAGPYPGLNSTNCFAIGISNPGFTGTVNIHNNIFRNGQPGGTAFNIATTAATINGDHNNLVGTGSIGRYNGVEYTSISTWSAATGLDANSISLDPLVTHEPFPGRWLSAELPPNDLHFTGAVNPLLNAPLLDLVPVDIDGEDRATTLTPGITTMGADVVVDGDFDGIPDALEDFAPNNGDGNFDGIPDRLQPHVATILLPTDVVRTITLETSAGVFADVDAVANPAPEDAPEGVEFPIGFFNFSIVGITPGSTVEVNVYLPEDINPTTWYKFGPTPDNPTPHWYDFIQSGGTGAEINANGITLTFTDGERGDSTLTVNGVIIDPGAPAISTTTVGRDWLQY